MTTFDTETFMAIKARYGHPGTVQEEVLSEHLDDGDKYTIAEFRAMFDDAEAKIPPPMRDNATVQVHIYEGGSSGSLDVTYVRPETEEEINHRVLSAMNGVRAARERELREFERLKAKFGNV